jgi:hypothetical protein
MKYAGYMGTDTASQFLYTNNTKASQTINMIHVSAGNASPAAFNMYFVPRGGGLVNIFPKNCSPAPLGEITCKAVPFTLEPGDSIVGIGTVTNYLVTID